MQEEGGSSACLLFCKRTGVVSGVWQMECVCAHVCERQMERELEMGRKRKERWREDNGIWKDIARERCSREGDREWVMEITECNLQRD